MDTTEVRDAIESRLRQECYAAVLPGVTVAAGDDFFELGGDSVMLIRVIVLAQQAFDVDLEALPFFEQPTITTLVDEVLRARAAAGDDEAMRALLERIEHMSEAELARLTR